MSEQDQSMKNIIIDNSNISVKDQRLDKIFWFKIVISVLFGMSYDVPVSCRRHSCRNNYNQMAKAPVRGSG
mgnify:CR=1 FL=1